MSGPRYYRSPSTGLVYREGEVGFGSSNPVAAHYRPVVVIDPEDEEAVERLARAFVDVLPDVEHSRAAMQSALRELAKPPKPEEPTGLGAVVEDADGEKWIKVYDFEYDTSCWARLARVADLNRWRPYDAIDVVRVLSEGVPES